MTRPLRLHLASLLMGSALLGCAALRSADRPETGLAAEPARVQVINRGWSNMVIYADRAGSRVRLGSVASLSSARLALPPAVVNPGSTFRLVASPIGSSETHTTEPVSVMPGELLEFEIHENLALSNVSVWAQ